MLSSGIGKVNNSNTKVLITLLTYSFSNKVDGG